MFSSSLDEARLRLLRLSARALTDTELLALVLDSHSGLPEVLAGQPLDQLALTPPDELIDGGEVKPKVVARLFAALELGRRALLVPALQRKDLTSVEALYQLVKPLLAHLRREEFWVICLSPRGKLLKHVRVAEGAAWACTVDPREVFAPAISCRASGIVLAHNHPSGDFTPSAADYALTRQLQAAGKLLCISIVDHLVVSRSGYVSMAVAGDLDFAPLTRPQAG